MKKTSFITLSALFGALIFVVTRYVQVGLPSGGYVHVGDAFIYLCACMLPAPYAMSAGAIGASLADLTAGYAIYIPATIIVKAALVIPFTAKSDKIVTVRNVVATVVATAIGMAGYFVADWIITGSVTAALGNMLFGLTQPVVSAIVFVLIGLSLDGVKFKKRIKL